MLSVFLSNTGKSIWQTEEPTVTESQLQEDYLQPNGFAWKRIVRTPSLVFVEIDPKKTPLQDFYTWDEALKVSHRLECWRSFYFFRDANGADWFSGKHLPDSELEGIPIHKYYEEILAFQSKEQNNCALAS